jgi:hypothetical protein
MLFRKISSGIVAQRRIKNPITSPGEKDKSGIFISGLRPSYKKAEKGNNTKGRTIYKNGKNVCASESNGLFSFLNNSVIIITGTGIISRTSHRTGR